MDPLSKNDMIKIILIKPSNTPINYFHDINQIIIDKQKYEFDGIFRNSNDTSFKKKLYDGCQNFLQFKDSLFVNYGSSDFKKIIKQKGSCVLNVIMEYLLKKKNEHFHLNLSLVEFSKGKSKDLIDLKEKDDDFERIKILNNEEFKSLIRKKIVIEKNQLEKVLVIMFYTIIFKV